MKGLFSDRFWIVKAAAALGLFAWLCNRSEQEISTLSPPSELAVLESMRGRSTSFLARRVVNVKPEGFEVASNVGPLLIVSTAAPPLGATVSVVGRITAPRTIEALSIRINEGYRWKRSLTYGVSIVTVILVLAALRRRFRGRLREGVFQGRY
jgi:hypothetical protein